MTVARQGRRARASMDGFTACHEIRFLPLSLHVSTHPFYKCGRLALNFAMPTITR